MRYRILPLALVTLLLGVTACASGPSQSPRASAPPPAATSSPEPSGPDLLDPDGNFVLSVSNQSFAIDPVDILIEIDGEHVIDGDFAVGSQHTWKRYVLRLSPGRHTLTARSSRGEASLVESFVVPDDRRWAALSYWYSTDAYGSPPEPKHFEFRIYDKPVKFA